MELKDYQKKVIGQLNNFLQKLNETNNIETAYVNHWSDYDIPVGFDGIQPYQNNIKNTPNICFKVPTGGGKTLLACSSIKSVFESMPVTKTKVVVWLVPSNTILEQTIKSLNDTNHPYRKRIDCDFNGRVEVYTKEQLLMGQNFNPTSVREQLSILILSYDSLRANRKDGKKVYKENGNLNQFTKFYNTPETLIDGIDDTSLIQVINQMSPVVIVDESHNATSDLSIEMLKNLNPSFIIDLTATPKDNSNIISYVDAMELKKENMVKLPVIVYNRKNQKDVILDAIGLRNRLEQQAQEEEKITGKYIRPIVLFQAQPKGNENNETFEKLKNELVNIGIPKEYIAIKTSNINELKGIDLLSNNCDIRYIITVNALKEGWDCPFAYILATLANKNSRVDVEQILGRILRQPYTTKHETPFLNMSYVVTSSNDFRETLDKVVVGLNKAGFSRSDCREESYIESEDIEENSIIEERNKQLYIEVADKVIEDIAVQETNEEFLEVDFDEVKNILQERVENEIDNKVLNNDITDMFNSAINYNYEYEKGIEESSSVEGGIPMELSDKKNSFKMNIEFKEEAQSLSIPNFFIKSEPNLFITDEFTLLTKERLTDGFSLRNKDTSIDFETLDNDVAKIDIEGNGDAIPKYSKLSKNERIYFKEYFSNMPEESKLKNCKSIIFNIINKMNKMDTIDGRELKSYIDRVVDNMTKDQIDNLENFAHSYAKKIKKKIINLQEQYLEEQFEKMIEQGIIVCEENYKFKNEISPINRISSITKSLYMEEENINNFEYRLITEIASLDNVKWWHRNIDKKEFCINGFINHYPDFIVMMKSGKIVLIEAKGDHLENAESRQKLKLGRVWQHNSDNKYRYYMVFESKDLKLDGAFEFDKFMDIIKNL